MLKIITGRISSSKTHILVEDIGKRIKERKKSILIVPDQVTYNFEQRLCAQLDILGFIDVEVCSFNRLASSIIDYFGKNNPNCFALHLYDVTEFEEYLTLRDMRSISKNADMPQYIKFIYDNDPLYEVIKEWDEAFSLDGNLCDNPSKTKQMILQKARMKGRK